VRKTNNTIHKNNQKKASNAYTLFNLILKKISKIGATRCQILRLKCTKIDFGWGSPPDPAGELTAVPQTPYLYLTGSTKGKEGEGQEKREREGKGREGRTTLHTPVANSWLRH